MKKLKNLTILLCFLSLLAFISCSAEDKMGGKTPPGGETETTETIEEIDAEGFPTELFGTYRDERLPNDDKYRNAKVSLFGQDIWIKGYQKFRKKDGSAEGIQDMDSKIKKWKKTTKGGKIIKVEEEHGGYIITFDYETKTISGTYTAAGEKWSFSGTKK